MLVADGRKFLLLVNEGDTEIADLRLVEAAEQELLPDRELSADRPGRTFNSADARRSGYEETDFKQQAEDRFAASAAALLNARVRSRKGARLFVIAPPRTLGEMRPRFNKATAARIVAEIPKEATNLPPAAIAALIAAA